MPYHPIPPIRPSIKLEKSFSFRGTTRIWSNRYFITGPAPADTAHWTTLSDAVNVAERLIYTNAVTITGAFGYLAGSDVPVFTKTYATAGTGVFAGQAQAGEVVSLVRYSTSSRTAKNHPLYLYSYYHSAVTTSAALPDTLLAAQKTAIQTYANLWVAGFNDGTSVQVRCGPQGQPSTAALVEPYVTHRDFPRG
jgi:hypothetical protein